MKKYLTMAMAAACALSFTACHDDDDDDDKDYVADFTTINQVSYIPGAQTAANKLGLNAFMLSDVNGYTDVTCYMSADSTEITPNMQISEGMFENFYGGICPTAFTADNEEYTFFRPACGKYHSGSGALVCNSGTLCRALFMRRHFSVSLSAALGLLNTGDMNGLWVCPTAAYNLLTTEEGRTALGISSSPKNVEIRFVVYAYIKTIGLSSWSAFASMLKTNVKESDVKAKNYAVLAKTDANGNWTVKKDWQYVDLDDVEDYYVFECVLQVVDPSTGKTVSSFSLEDYGDGTNGLNYCMIDDITCESGSLF